jgi:ribulose-phosphate 3-epimerase
MMKKTVRTVPAILTDDTEALRAMVKQTEGFTDFVQFDLMDGRFVPSRSITCADIAALHTSLGWEAHIMVMEPESLLEDFKAAGAKKVIFHYEATENPGDIIEKIHGLGMEAGLAINPDTTIVQIQPFVDAADSILFMAVVPGFYGAKFIPEVLDKVREFRKTYPDKETGLDGGVNGDTIPDIVKAGVDAINIGSAIYRQPDPAEAYRQLDKLANDNAG